jgi:hypothetical protein
MAAKEVKFSSDARERMLRGVDTLANAVMATGGCRRKRKIPQGGHRFIKRPYRRVSRIGLGLKTRSRLGHKGTSIYREPCYNRSVDSPGDISGIISRTSPSSPPKQTQSPDAYFEYDRSARSRHGVPRHSEPDASQPRPCAHAIHDDRIVPPIIGNIFDASMRSRPWRNIQCANAIAVLAEDYVIRPTPRHLGDHEKPLITHQS